MCANFELLRPSIAANYVSGVANIARVASKKYEPATADGSDSDSA